MTTNTQIQYVLSYITVEAYMAGIDDGMPLTFVPGNKTQGNSPRIEKKDGTVPSYLPALKLGDSNSMIMNKLEAATNVFYAFRKSAETKK